jgi:hypothetical protein
MRRECGLLPLETINGLLTEQIVCPPGARYEQAGAFAPASRYWPKEGRLAIADRRRRKATRARNRGKIQDGGGGGGGGAFNDGSDDEESDDAFDGGCDGGGEDAGDSLKSSTAVTTSSTEEGSTVVERHPYDGLSEKEIIRVLTKRINASVRRHGSAAARYYGNTSHVHVQRGVSFGHAPAFTNETGRIPMGAVHGTGDEHNEAAPGVGAYTPHLGLAMAERRQRVRKPLRPRSLRSDTAQNEWLMSGKAGVCTGIDRMPGPGQYTPCYAGVDAATRKSVMSDDANRVLYRDLMRRRAGPGPQSYVQRSDIEQRTSDIRSGRLSRGVHAFVGPHASISTDAVVGALLIGIGVPRDDTRTQAVSTRSKIGTTFAQHGASIQQRPVNWRRYDAVTPAPGDHHIAAAARGAFPPARRTRELLSRGYTFAHVERDANLESGATEASRPRRAFRRTRKQKKSREQVARQREHARQVLLADVEDEDGAMANELRDALAYRQRRKTMTHHRPKSAPAMRKSQRRQEMAKQKRSASRAGGRGGGGDKIELSVVELRGVGAVRDDNDDAVEAKSGGEEDDDSIDDTVDESVFDESLAVTRNEHTFEDLKAGARHTRVIRDVFARRTAQNRARLAQKDALTSNGQRAETDAGAEAHRDGELRAVSSSILHAYTFNKEADDGERHLKLILFKHSKVELQQVWLMLIASMARTNSWRHDSFAQLGVRSLLTNHERVTVIAREAALHWLATVRRGRQNRAAWSIQTLVRRYLYRRRKRRRHADADVLKLTLRDFQSFARTKTAVLTFIFRIRQLQRVCRCSLRVRVARKEYLLQLWRVCCAQRRDYFTSLRAALKKGDDLPAAWQLQSDSAATSIQSVDVAAAFASVSKLPDSSTPAIGSVCEFGILASQRDDVLDAEYRSVQRGMIRANYRLRAFDTGSEGHDFTILGSPAFTVTHGRELHYRMKWIHHTSIENIAACIERALRRRYKSQRRVSIYKMRKSGSAIRKSGVRI